ncbi:MAG TPA: hypothetical protein PLX89_19310 [Verrucomicrobiota bacterium]|nr:hypothetical protein [Verrucomicrobiales bacterium]HRI15149.1 hypothetical protein [Verrucomicrobiota bacterium]
METPAASSSRIQGEVVYLYAFDIAYELSREPIQTLLGQPVAQFSVDVSRRGPKNLLFHQPQMVRLPAWERRAPFGSVRLDITVKVLPIGAISISARMPFALDRLEQLVDFHDLHFNNGSLHDEVQRLAHDVQRDLAKHIIRPIEQVAPEEAYTVFCLNSPVCGDGGSPLRAELWLEQHRRAVASILTQESADSLSRQEAVESTSKSLSYYEDDLVVIDWDAALLVDQPKDFDETLHILELANVQLAELEAYDRVLDAALERSYRDLRSAPMRRRAEVLRDLRELQIDMARFNDELSNITKFFGDWHLARVYEAVAKRFHLSDWHRAVADKLKTLDELHQLLKSDQSNRWMMILEVTIVLLFIIDLAILFIGARH